MMDLKQLDKQYVWHPFTQMKQYIESDPLVIERGEGSYLIDTEGNRYLDGYASLWVNVHGHNDAAMNEAIIDQLGKIAHSTLLGAGNVPSILLAEQLAKRLPGNLNKTFYSDTGSAAIEIALKMAYQYWKNKDGERYKDRNLFLSLKEAYHGDTIGSISVGGVDLFHSVFEPLLFKSLKVNTPHTYRMDVESEEEARDRVLDEIEQVMERHHEQIAAFILEPLMQAAAGMLRHPDGFLKGIERLCRKYDILLIVDEVAVGFGRTGTLFAIEKEDVIPDIICLGKGLTGGYVPLAATVASDEIYNMFLGDGYGDQTFLHGHTYTGNQVTCRAALRNLELFDERQIIAHVQSSIEYIEPYLDALRQMEEVGDVRAQGLMIGVELVSNQQAKTPLDAARVARILAICKEEGLIIRNLGSILTIVPVLMMSHDELKRLFTIVIQAIQQSK